MAEWTKQEYEVAMQQRDDLFPVCGEETAKNILNLLCQRNRALAALNAAIKMPRAWMWGLGMDVEEWDAIWQQIDSAIAACKANND
jgi:hypothetical protein